MATTDLAENIIILPNGTFFVELIIFVIVLIVLGWYVAPAISKALRQRQEMVDREAEESRLAVEKLTKAERRYAEALSEARTESSNIRDAARQDGQQTLDGLRSSAQAEAALIGQRGAEELAAQRTQAMRDLRPHVGELAMSLAGRVVGGEVVSGKRQEATISRFLGELEGNV
jgi:F-type H+-transporting ATPase subunit b